MCIFSQPVLSVNNTQIFVRHTGKGSQVVAYQMTYESRDINAMILPIPVQQPANAESLRFIALDEYENLFEDLASGFPYFNSMSIGCSSGELSLKEANLQVFEVGNYIASFVPAVADFNRLDPQFRLPEETWAHLPNYAGFGFAVFQLASGALKPHPMAFEYKTFQSDLFFPTVHIHDGEIHTFEDFDHILYLQHAGFDSRVYGYKNSTIEDPATHWIRSKQPAAAFCQIDQSAGLLAGNLLVHRKILRGEFPNNDTIVKMVGDPLIPTFNFRSLAFYYPLGLVIAAFAWLFYRRAKLKKIENTSKRGLVHLHDQANRH